MLSDSELDPFIQLACAPYDVAMVDEQLALGNVKAYGAAVTVLATEPEKLDLGATLMRLSSAKKSLDLANVESSQGTPEISDDVKNLRAEIRSLYLACEEDVKTTLKPSDATTGISGVAGGVLAAWPAIKKLFETLGQQWERSEREAQLVALLQDANNQKLLKDSMAVLAKSGENRGDLAVFLLQHKRLALWAAQEHWRESLNKDKQPDYLKRFQSAKLMGESFAVFDGLHKMDVTKVLGAMEKANQTLVDAAVNGELPPDYQAGSALAELISAMDFLSSVNDSYKKAVDAYDKAN